MRAFRIDYTAPQGGKKGIGDLKAKDYIIQTNYNLGDMAGGAGASNNTYGY
jgi:hypothetical protein